MQVQIQCKYKCTANATAYRIQIQLQMQAESLHIYKAVNIVCAMQNGVQTHKHNGSI